MRRPRVQALSELHPYAHRWGVGGVGIVALAALVTACVSTGPISNAPYQGPYQPSGPRGEALTGEPRIIPAPPMSCVPFARSRSNINILGDANTWWPQASSLGYGTSNRPDPGDVMVLRVSPEGTRGHVAFVKRVASRREIFVDHANWHGREEVAVDIPVIDVSPNNDWSEVRVFWVDSGKMGARSYPVEGFIQPRGGRPGA
jgi:hypothetical protein